MKILVTGGAGFIGSSLGVALAGVGHSVTCLDNLSRRASICSRPKGSLTLTISGNDKVKEELSMYLDKMKKAA